MKYSRILVVFLIACFCSSTTEALDYRTLDSEVLLQEIAPGNSTLRRGKAMRELSMRRDPEAVSSIMALQQSPYLNVRLDALRSLGRYRDPSLLKFFEEIILDYEGKYTPQERIVAAKAYVNIDGYDLSVLQTSMELADNPIEAEVISSLINGEPRFFLKKF